MKVHVHRPLPLKFNVLSDVTEIKLELRRPLNGDMHMRRARPLGIVEITASCRVQISGRTQRCRDPVMRALSMEADFDLHMTFRYGTGHFLNSANKNIFSTLNRFPLSTLRKRTDELYRREPIEYEIADVEGACQSLRRAERHET
ncbi:hypothetical protein EVAR_52431_1 [Eumeta japonica]|uniref:Uncharacterized protein n=1 Tax=Eumeta variegata TaxID=151549 RepID=A0A4C1YFP8_EUMVA|nr:hypothetical protein EVAR_52431_1 [Eumeta japonica]